jgi:uncharacterized lipoprotein YddW (UPF0748 family)
VDNQTDGPYHRISVRARATSFRHKHDRLPQLVCRLVACLWLVCAAATPSSAQDTTPRWRAVFIDTFNSRIGTAEEVATVVSRAVAWNVNVLYVQVRRRGDAFYLDGTEPAPEGMTVENGFDPLGELLSRARSAGLEVHALLTLGPVWHLSSAPQDPRHVFARHGMQNERPIDGAENWLTRTLLPDGNGTSMDGYRFGSDFWLDFGHPAAVNYVVDVVTRLVERYPVDGIRLDGLQYPEAPAGAASIGYNMVSVSRYQARTSHLGVPGQDDESWSAWRREQITALTRRLAVSAYAVRPSLIVSVSAVAAGAPPGDPRGGLAFSRTFQDWLRWAADGSVDVIVPQVYRQEHVPTGADEFSGWTAWLAANRSARPFVIGLGAYQNSLEGLLRQARVGLGAAGVQGGVSIFSLAATNAPVVNNPFSSPAGRDTPQRAFEDVAAALRTGRTTGGQVVDPIQPPLFAVAVPHPATPWKGSIGHVLGRIEDVNGAPVDGAHVRLDASGRTDGPDDVVSDGSGVFAAPAVAPGSYRLQLVSPTGSAFTSACTIDVSAQNVTRITLSVDASRAGVASCK